MADENGDVKGVDLEDSNMANYGSQEHKDARKAAAESEKEFVGAGQKPGLEIWRVENRRTEADTPDFGVKRWPKEDYGQFYDGDSYIILNTYKEKDETGKYTDKLLWDVHFWLGSESSQDEIGVAAYKTVELDDLLDDGPVQHRETQGHESALFQSYFKEIQYLKGGIASGFRKVKPEEYEPRLFQVRRTKKTVRAFQVDCKASAMNKGDVFVLDTGFKVYTWVGEAANAFEKMKGGAMAHNICSSREGKTKRADIDDDFWKTLGGSESDVQDAVEHEDEDETMHPEKLKVFKLSDASGKLTFEKVSDGPTSYDILDPNDVFIVDGGYTVFVWIGKGASKAEKSNGMKTADEYLKAEGRPSNVSVALIKQGQISHAFRGLFKA